MISSFAEERVCQFGAGAQARVYFPEGAESGGQFPVMINYYGRGGNAIEGATNFGSAGFEEFRRQCAVRGFIVVVPECGSDDWFGPHGEAVSEEIVMHLPEVLPADMSRLYLMGESMGGGAAVIMAAHHPGVFRAVCDVFGVVDILDNMKNNPGHVQGIVASYGGWPEERPQIYQDHIAVNHAEALKEIPLMILHGMEDNVVPHEASDRLVQVLRDAGGHPIYLRVPRIGHDNDIIKGYEKAVLDFFETADGPRLN